MIRRERERERSKPKHGMPPANLFDHLLPAGDAESFATLLDAPDVRIERIVSTGQCSPPGFWYDQPRAEWVAVLAGAARLRFEDEPSARTLRPGDYVAIAPHRRHRVEWTHPDEPTVWLAVHYRVAFVSAPIGSGAAPT